jgi:hypothetical protein
MHQEISMKLRSAARYLIAIGMALPALSQAEETPVGSATSPNGKVRVEILSLKKWEGDTLQLRWRVVNNDNTTYKMTPLNTRLVDMAARREYTAGLVSNCYTEPDQPLICWAIFGRPPTNVKTMTVHFYEQLDLVPGIPISE